MEKKKKRTTVRTDKRWRAAAVGNIKTRVRNCDDGAERRQQLLESPKHKNTPTGRTNQSRVFDYRRDVFDESVTSVRV